MTHPPPTILAAARSGKLHGATLAVFIELHEWIGTDEFKTVKAWCIAERLKMSTRQVYRAVSLLVDLRYLEVGERLGNAQTFRLVAVKQECAA